MLFNAALNRKEDDIYLKSESFVALYFLSIENIFTG